MTLILNRSGELMELEQPSPTDSKKNLVSNSKVALSFFVVFVARVIAIGLCADDMKIGEKLQSRSNYLTDK